MNWKPDPIAQHQFLTLLMFKAQNILLFYAYARVSVQNLVTRILCAVREYVTGFLFVTHVHLFFLQ